VYFFDIVLEEFVQSWVFWPTSGKQENYDVKWCETCGVIQQQQG